jgi:hypothetical protein
MHIDWQIVTHEFERRVQEDGDVRIGFSKGVLENAHSVDGGHRAAVIEQNGADIAKHTRAIREPPGHVERRRHSLRAG